MIRIALDACGGDFGPKVTAPAALEALRRRPDLHITLTALSDPRTILAGRMSAGESARLKFERCETVLDSGVGPVAAIRAGQDSSLGKAMALHADGHADACVSAGSTTALMTLGMKMLGLLPGVKRPALMSRMPSASGDTVLLDLGANLKVSAEQLVQFALMGLVVRGEEQGQAPRIGLLNVGHEDSKGHAVVREAHSRLQSLPLNYHGFIEGNDIFSGEVDIAVCDGFSGNLVLKSSEGLARMLFGALKGAMYSNWRSKLGAAMAGPALRSLVARFDPAKHNGAPLLGLDGVVVKSHGSSRVPATTQAILEACDEAGKQVPGKIRALIEKHKAESEQ